MLAGAVYLPVGSIDPQAPPAQPAPTTLQITVWSASGGLTAALNCCVAPAWTVAAAGEMVTPVGPVMMCAVALADFVGSESEVAVILTVFWLGTAPGAVYIPFEPIVPQPAPAQPFPDTPQETPLLVGSSRTVALNCSERPTVTQAVVGTTLTTMGTAAGGAACGAVVPPHPARNKTLAVARMIRARISVWLVSHFRPSISHNDNRA